MLEGRGEGFEGERGGESGGGGISSTPYGLCELKVRQLKSS